MVDITRGNSFNPLVKVDIGIIKKVTMLSNEHVYYTVFLENYHQENESAEGIPIFSFGYNTYTYLEKSRVLCLIKDSDFTKVFIIGQTYDPNVIRGIGAAKEGELNISADKSGVIGIGSGDNLHAYAGSSSLTLNSNKVKIMIGKENNINFNPNEFNVSLNNNENFNIKNGVATLNASKGFKVISPKGNIFMTGDAFTFSERIDGTPSYLITNNIHRLTGSEFLSLFSVYSFEVGSSKIKGKDYAVDWNVLQGSYGIRLTSGDFKVTLLNPLGSEYSIKIGPSDLLFSSFILDQTSLSLEIDSSFPIPYANSKFKLKADELTLDIKTLVPTLQSQTNFEITTSKINFKNIDLTGTKTAYLEIMSGNLVLKSANKTLGGKITLDGEVEITGNLTVKGTTGIEATTGDIKSTIGDVMATSISLKNHKHASSIPGGPTPPLPG